MPITNTGETIVYTSIFDATNEPKVNEWEYGDTGAYVQGDDGNYYQITNKVASSRDFNVYRINTTTVSRTLSETFSESTFESRVLSATGLAAPAASGPQIVGILHPKKYILCAQSSLTTAGTTFSLWKINSSGVMQCVAAINYGHGSQINKLMYYIGCCGITNNRTNADPIVIVYGGQQAGGSDYLRAWRLPSITDFIAASGSVYSETVTNNNNVPFEGTWDAYWGPKFTSLAGGATQRTGRKFFWMVPYSSGTRLYFYIGPNDVLNSPISPTSFNYQMSLLHGDQFVGYIDLGTVVYTGTWIPNLTRYVNLDLVQAFNNEGSLFPFLLYHADGVTGDTSGYGDFSPGATVQVLTNGRFLITMGGWLQYKHFNQYTGASYDLIGRWLAFFYDPATGIHRMVGRGTFNPCTMAQASLSATPPSALAMEPSGITIFYDESLRRLFWNANYRLWGQSSLIQDKTAFGMINRTIDFDFTGEPCFMTETDATYYDFTARYP